MLDNIVSYQEESYNTYNIIPDFTVDNSDNDTITHAISNIYEDPRSRVNLLNKCKVNGKTKFDILSYSEPQKVIFNILFTKNESKFYMSIPNKYSDFVVGKMSTVWNKSTIESTITKNIREFNKENTEICELILKDYNFKSLNTDKKNLYPLTNMFGILKVLKEGEKVRVVIVIEPIRRVNWVDVTKDEYKDFQKGKILNREMSSKEKAALLGFKAADTALSLFIEYKLLLLECVAGLFINFDDEKEDKKIDVKIDSLEALKQELALNRLSTSTTHKMTSEAFKSRIIIMSDSKDNTRAKLNMLAVANSYKDLTEDNELIFKLYDKKKQGKIFDDVMLNRVSTTKECILSDKEIAKLIQLPQKDLQNEYKIESIDTREVDVPGELQNGKVRIGIAEKQGKKVTATWSMDKNVMSLAKLFVGPQNAGKTTALKRTVKECHKAGYSNIVIDFIESCETAREVSEVIADNEKVVIKLGTKDLIPSLAYNEVSRLITEDMDPWERIRLANLLSEQVEYLVNAVTDSTTGELTAPMLRYLHAASMIAFIRPGAKIDDIFTILRRWDKRNEALRYAKYSNCFDADDDIFFDLEELHKRDKDGKIVGTREDLIIGITNRIILLQKNPYIKAMLKADIDTSQDFAKYIEEGKSIFIMIPQNLFPNVMIRDILTTFFVSRIWLTVQMRENNKDARLCNVIFDEVHQVPTTARFLSNHVTEFRRHRLGLILSCHYIKQLGDLLTALKSSGVSYVLIAGTEKENLQNLKEELTPFTVEDGLNLKPHHSLNIVNYGNRYAKFITALPEK